MDHLTIFLDTLQMEKEYSANTIQAYAGDLRRLSAFLGTSRSIDLLKDEVSVIDFIAFLEEETHLGYSSNTLQRRKMVLVQFAQYLAAGNIFASNGLDDLIAWRPNLWQEIYQQEIQVLTEEQISALLTLPEQGGVVKTVRDLAIISLLLETGLSIREILSLHVKDYDPEDKLLQTSTPGGGEFVYRVSHSAKYLNVYLRSERPEVVQSPHEEVLFISQMGGPITRQGVWQMLKAVGERATLELSLSPRVLRHTAVKRMVADGLRANEIQSRLGHRNIYSTRALIRKVKRAVKSE